MLAAEFGQELRTGSPHQCEQRGEVRQQHAHVGLTAGPQFFKDRLLKQHEFAVETQKLGGGGISPDEYGGAGDPIVETRLHSLAPWPVIRAYHNR